MKNLGIYAIIFIFMLLFGVYCVAFTFSQTDLLLVIADEQYSDSLHAAYSLGRLDLITSLLAIVTVTLVMFGFIGYERIKTRSEQIAHESTKAYLNDNFEKWMSNNAAEFVGRWLNQVENIEKVKDVIANDISMHVDPNND